MRHVKVVLHGTEVEYANEIELGVQAATVSAPLSMYTIFVDREGNHDSPVSKL